MYSLLSYILISEAAYLLDTTVGTIAFVVSLLVFLGAFGVLVSVLIRRGNRYLKRLDSTSVLPSVRAAKMRKKYL